MKNKFALITFFSLLLFFTGAYSAFAGPGDEEALVKQKVNYVKDKGLLVSQLVPGDLSTLPLGIVREIDGKSFIIAIDSARITPQGGFFSAYAAVKLPNTSDDDVLAFAAKNISFKPNGGIGVSSSTRLMLVSERTISISEKVKLRLPADGTNYIEWDCNGFQSVSLKGEFIFDRSMIEPDLELDPGATNVKATFQVVGQRGFNFLINTSITPFKVAGMGDMAFSVTDATVDLSDLSNPTDFYYPVDYPSYFGGDAALWRGFYLKELQVKLPKGISTNQGRAVFTAHNVVIDEMGVSGFMGVRNLFDINSGSVDGWALSIDTVGIQLLQNRLVGGALGGTMNVPFLKDDTLGYTAEIEQRDGDLNFRFLIRTNATHVYNMAWGGTLRLDEGSQVSIQKYNGQLRAGALLHGSVTVSQPLMNIDSLRFQNLELSTQSPYLIRATFALANNTPGASKSRMAKFPISVSNMSFGLDNGAAYLKTDVAFNLMNESERGFSAKTSVMIKARMTETVQMIDNTEFKKHKWNFDGIQINTVSLDAHIGSLDLNGTLTIFNNDPLYGDGFHGNISMKFAPLSGYIKANVYFGSKDEGAGDFRYWQANVYVPVGTVPIVPPIVNLTGILGGASYHMNRVYENSDATFASLTSSSQLPTTDPASLANRTSLPEFSFVPSSSAGLGIMLGVTLAIPKAEVINADATLGVEFNTNGGLNQVYFRGGAYFFMGLNRVRKDFKTEEAAKEAVPAPVYAFLDMVYDNPNKVFHASIKTYMNLANVIKGINEHDLVGEAVVHVDPRDWYVYIGRPSQMFGIDLINVVQARTYFMMGTRIENMPAPPPQITEILGGNWTPPSYGGAMAAGNGFGFGAHFNINKDFTMKPFYANFGIGAGADIMITKYNGQVNCGGTVLVPGLNGWYAAGQVYAYVQGGIGLQIKGKKFSIIDVAAAAILQARLPNPTFMKGAVGGRFRILGGLVKGNVRFSFTIGQDCSPVNGGGSEIDDIKVISSMKPDSLASGVSVFAKPTAAFNIPLDTEMPLVEDDGNVHTYRVTPVSVTLINQATSGEEPGDIQYSNVKDAVVYNATNQLAGNATYKFKVVVKWQEKNSAGSWVNPGGQEELETKEYAFTTGTAPTSVPLENIAYSYPVSRQYNLYKNQSTQGYLQLKTGQPEVFATTDQFGQWTVTAKFIGSDGSAHESPVTYNTSTKRASFNIPTGLSNEKIYSLAIIKAPVGTVAGRGIQDSLLLGEEQNMYVSETSSLLDEMNAGFSMVNQDEMSGINNANANPVQAPEGTTSMANRVANNVNVSTELIIYKINFRTSKFNTLNEKITALNSPQDALNVVSGGVTAIAKRYSTTESFDEVELFGRGNNNIPLIQLNATAANDWYSQKINPLMYESYGFNSAVDISWRNPSDLMEPSIDDIAPMKGVKLHNNLYPDGYVLTDDQVNTGYAPAKDDDIMFAYYLSYYCSRDFAELRNKAAVLYLADGVTTMPPAAERLIYEAGYTDLMPGQYKVKANYMLPGDGQGTFSSAKELDLFFRNGSSGAVILDNPFNSGTETWTAAPAGFGHGNVSVSNVSGRLKASSTVSADGGGMRKTIQTIPGRQYKFSVDVDKGDCAALKVSVKDFGLNDLATQTTSANGRIELTFTANGETVVLYVERQTSGTALYIDNVKVVTQ